MGKKKFGIMGNGYLAGIIVDGYLSGILDEYELVGVMGRTPDKTAAIAGRGGCKACGTVEELLALKPDVVAEGRIRTMYKGQRRKDIVLGCGSNCAFHRRICR